MKLFTKAVEFCKDCPGHRGFYYTDGSEHSCVISEIKSLPNYPIIPEWCPLEDYKENDPS